MITESSNASIVWTTPEAFLHAAPDQARADGALATRLVLLGLGCDGADRSGASQRIVCGQQCGAAVHGNLAEMSFTRISVRADQMGGAPCIRGLRIPVATVVGMLADGMSIEEILAAYPDLEAEDVREAMRYAAEAVQERELPLAASA